MRSLDPRRLPSATFRCFAIFGSARVLRAPCARSWTDSLCVSTPRLVPCPRSVVWLLFASQVDHAGACLAPPSASLLSSASTNGSLSALGVFALA